jgi:hypothetical protein
VKGSIPDGVIDLFFNLPNLSSRISHLGFTKPLTEISTEAEKMFVASRLRQARKADNLSTIC